MKFTCEIDMNGAAFDDPFALDELQRIVLFVASRVHDFVHVAGDPLPVKDINGNTVGFWKVDS